MTKEQSQVQDFMRKAEQPCPPKPTIPDLKTRKLRARLMMEEVLETINDGLGLMVTLTVNDGGDLDMKYLSFEEEKEPNLVELADGLADLHFVAYCGTANAFGIDMEPVFKEVDRSNHEKFKNGVIKNAHGKVVKPDDWFPPDIESIINAQIQKP